MTSYGKYSMVNILFCISIMLLSITVFTLAILFDWDIFLSFPSSELLFTPFLTIFKKLKYSWYTIWVFPGGTSCKEPTCQCRRRKGYGFDPWVRKIPWRRAQEPTALFLPGESLGQSNLVGYSPWDHKESDMTEWLINTFTSPKTNMNYSADQQLDLNYPARPTMALG